MRKFFISLSIFIVTLLLIVLFASLSVMNDLKCDNHGQCSFEKLSINFYIPEDWSKKITFSDFYLLLTENKQGNVADLFISRNKDARIKVALTDFRHLKNYSVDLLGYVHFVTDTSQKEKGCEIITEPYLEQIGGQEFAITLKKDSSDNAILTYDLYDVKKNEIYTLSLITPKKNLNLYKPDFLKFVRSFIVK